MRTGRPKQPLVLNPADKEKLSLLARRPKTAQRVAVRSKIVLRAAEGLSNQAIALQLGVTGATVGKWRERYRLQGMKGLADDSRQGRPRRITDAMVEEAVTQTLESLPPAATYGGELPAAPGHPFYSRLNEVLEKAEFDRFCEKSCARFYHAKLGRLSLAPGLYFRIMMVGFFEGIDSERGIDWRLADSLTLRSSSRSAWTSKRRIT